MRSPRIWPIEGTGYLVLSDSGMHHHVSRPPCIIGGDPHKEAMSLRTTADQIVRAAYVPVLSSNSTAAIASAAAAREPVKRCSKCHCTAAEHLTQDDFSCPLRAAPRDLDAIASSLFDKFISMRNPIPIPSQLRGLILAHLEEAIRSNRAAEHAERVA